MSPRSPARRPPPRQPESAALVHALRTNQVDAIVGDRTVTLVRLRQAEEELQRSRDELRALTAALQVERERERAAIAREIHDELGQALTSVQLGLSWMARTVAPTGRPILAKIASLSALVTTTIRSVKRIAVGLRPGTLDELGLLRTLRSEARTFQTNTGIRCRYKTNLRNARFHPAGSVAVFRITQAALTNVARHARASRAAVSVMKRSRDLVLTVSDNGTGIARKGIRGHNSLGIVGMRERVVALDGSVTFGGARGRGTTLTVRIPLSRVLLGRAAAPPRAPGQS
jgi:signal transduction histidine kinase